MRGLLGRNDRKLDEEIETIIPCIRCRINHRRNDRKLDEEIETGKFEYTSLYRCYGRNDRKLDEEIETLKAQYPRSL